MLPELQMQIQRPIGLARPFIGAGIGLVGSFGKADPTHFEPSFSAGSGLRLALGAGIEGRFDIRARGIGTGFGGSITEASLGLGGRF